MIAQVVCLVQGIHQPVAELAVGGIEIRLQRLAGNERQPRPLAQDDVDLVFPAVALHFPADTLGKQPFVGPRMHAGQPCQLLKPATGEKTPSRSIQRTHMPVPLANEAVLQQAFQHGRGVFRQRGTGSSIQPRAVQQRIAQGLEGAIVVAYAAQQRLTRQRLVLVTTAALEEGVALLEQFGNGRHVGRLFPQMMAFLPRQPRYGGLRPCPATDNLPPRTGNVRGGGNCIRGLSSAAFAG